MRLCIEIGFGCYDTHIWHAMRYDVLKFIMLFVCICTVYASARGGLMGIFYIQVLKDP